MSKKKHFLGNFQEFNYKIEKRGTSNRKHIVLWMGDYMYSSKFMQREIHINRKHVK